MTDDHKSQEVHDDFNDRIICQKHDKILRLDKDYNCHLHKANKEGNFPILELPYVIQRIFHEVEGLLKLITHRYVQDNRTKETGQYDLTVSGILLEGIDGFFFIQRFDKDEIDQTDLAYD